MNAGNRERFSIECRSAKNKESNLTNQKGHSEYSEPIKTESNYITKLMQSAGKRARPSHEWFYITSDWLKNRGEFFWEVMQNRSNCVS